MNPNQEVVLFDPERRGIGADYKRGTPMFRWLETDLREGAEAIRSEIESWLAEYPQGHGRNDLMARLRSSNDDAHREALLELWTYRVLQLLSYSPQPHPDLSDTSTRPDFRATVGGAAVYVECTSTRDSSQRTAAGARQDVFIDLIDALQLEGFMLDVDITEVGSTQPPTRRLRGELIRWIESLDHTEVLRRYEAGGYRDVPTFPWREDGWKVEFRPLPLKDPTERLAPSEGGAAGMIGSPTFVVTAAQRVRETARKKQDDYGTPDAPFVLVVTTAMRTREEHLIEALLGDRQWLIGADAVKESRRADGVWASERGIAGRRVSGVLFHDRLMAWEVATAEWTFVHHPDPFRPAPHGMFPFAKEITWSDGCASEHAPTRSLYAILGLPEGWPGPL